VSGTGAPGELVFIDTTPVEPFSESTMLSLEKFIAVIVVIVVGSASALVTFICFFCTLRSTQISPTICNSVSFLQLIIELRMCCCGLLGRCCAGRKGKKKDQQTKQAPDGDNKGQYNECVVHH
jgi:hypothetical protein